MKFKEWREASLAAYEEMERLREMRTVDCAGVKMEVIFSDYNLQGDPSIRAAGECFDHPIMGFSEEEAKAYFARMRKFEDWVFCGGDYPEEQSCSC